GPDATCARNARGERIRPMRKLRNCNLTTVAPTGTISIIAGCSSGIEPLFAVAFMRNQAGVLMPDVNEAFVAIARREGWYSDDLVKRIAEAGHIHFDEVPAQWQRVFVTAHDVTPEWHIRMQGAFQEFTDSAISKTCNFPHEATEEDVEQIYRLAFQLGCRSAAGHGFSDGSAPAPNGRWRPPAARQGRRLPRTRARACRPRRARPTGRRVAPGPRRLLPPRRC